MQPSSTQPSPDSNLGAAVPGESHRGIAAALVAARHLGLLQTVRLALQTVQTHLELQVQEEQAVVAEFDLPTAEHAQDSTAAWLVAPEAGRMLWQPSQKDGLISPSPGPNQLEHGQGLAGLEHDAEAGSGLLQQESERAQELVAKLQQGERLCHTQACHTSYALILCSFTWPHCSLPRENRPTFLCCKHSPTPSPSAHRLMQAAGMSHFV